MKIHQLPIGARFEYEGEVYVKTGPMMGTGNGGQRFFPKYAVLKSLDGPVATAEAKSENLSRSTVMQAFAMFHAECKKLVAEDRQSALAVARDTFLRVLK